MYGTERNTEFERKRERTNGTVSRNGRDTEFGRKGKRPKGNKWKQKGCPPIETEGLSIEQKQKGCLLKK